MDLVWRCDQEYQPSSSILVTTVASKSGVNPSRAWHPFIIGTPATAALSLIATRFPANLPPLAP